MHTVILNTCSTLNRGDAAIVLGQLRLLKECFPEARFTLTSKTPALDQAFYAPLGVEVLAPLTPALSAFQGTGRKLAAGARWLATWGDKRRLIRAVRQCDLIFSCGGGYFYSYRRTLPGTTFWQNVLQAYLAVAAGKPLVFFPQSFGPFTSSLARSGVKRMLEARNVLKIFAREAASQQLLEQMLDEGQQRKISLCPDMALYLKPDTEGGQGPSQPVDLGQPLLVMNLREWTFPDAVGIAVGQSKRAAYVEALVTCARAFIQRYQGRVVVVPQALGPDPSEDDRPICIEFCRLAHEQVPDDQAIQYREPDTGSLAEYLELLSRATVVVGTRLHSCLLALSVGVPAISVGYQLKSQGTFDLLGLGRFNANIVDVSAEWLLEAVDEIVAQRPEIQEEMGQRVSRARRQIDEQVGGLLRSWAAGAGQSGGE